MESIDSPAGLNQLQHYILKGVPSEAGCVVVLGAGDGRLSKAISRKAVGATVYSFEPEVRLHKYYDDKTTLYTNPWDVKRLEEMVMRFGGIDMLVVQNVHEYWKGNVLGLQKVFELMKPTGAGYFSFYNSASMFEISRQVPPLVVGSMRLASPFDLWPRMDLTSWMVYFSDVGVKVGEIWGLLQEDALAYCQRPAPEQKPEVWKAKELSITVKDIGDAFISGAPVVCFRLSLNTEVVDGPDTRFVGIPLTAEYMQSILIPNDNELSHELKVLTAQVEAYSYQHKDKEAPNEYLACFLEELRGYGGVKKVLVIGSGWGGELLALKKLRPDWDIVGAESDRELISVGEALVNEAGVRVVPIKKGEALPFNDKEFDLAVSIRHFSHIYTRYAAHLAKELLRVSKQGVAHFEDYRGPSISMYLKPTPVLDIYKELGKDASVIPIKSGDRLVGMYIVKVKD